MALSCPQSRRPLAVTPIKGQGAGTALRLYSTPPTKSILTEAQKSAEKKYAEEMLLVDPGAVTKESTVRPDYSATATQVADDDVDFLAGIKSDWVRLPYGVARFLLLWLRSRWVDRPES